MPYMKLNNAIHDCAASPRISIATSSRYGVKWQNTKQHPKNTAGAVGGVRSCNCVGQLGGFAYIYVHIHIHICTYILSITASPFSPKRRSLLCVPSSPPHTHGAGAGAGAGAGGMEDALQNTLRI